MADLKPEMETSKEGIVQTGRLQVLNDVRLLVHWVLQYYTERSRNPVDSSDLVGAITREVGTMEDHIPMLDPAKPSRQIDRGFLYYFVGNGNRKRLYRFLRTWILAYLEQATNLEHSDRLGEVSDVRNVQVRMATLHRQMPSSFRLRDRDIYLKCNDSHMRPIKSS